jgi:hypothetical protein
LPLGRFLGPPLRTRRATFTAPGSPESTLPCRRSLPGSSSARLSPSQPPTLQGAPVRCLAERCSPGALRPVAGFPDRRLRRRLRRHPGFTARSAGLRCRVASHVHADGLCEVVEVAVRRQPNRSSRLLTGDRVSQVYLSRPGGWPKPASGEHGELFEPVAPGHCPTRPGPFPNGPGSP